MAGRQNRQKMPEVSSPSPPGRRQFAIHAPIQEASVDPIEARLADASRAATQRDDGRQSAGWQVNSRPDTRFENRGVFAALARTGAAKVPIAARIRGTSDASLPLLPVSSGLMPAHGALKACGVARMGQYGGRPAPELDVRAQGRLPVRSARAGLARSSRPLRCNRVRYYGVLSTHSRHRARMVPLVVEALQASIQ
jgi:hypothetical protein